MCHGKRITMASLLASDSTKHSAALRQVSQLMHAANQLPFIFFFMSCSS